VSSKISFNVFEQMYENTQRKIKIFCTRQRACACKGAWRYAAEIAAWADAPLESKMIVGTSMTTNFHPERQT
jgi:predicted Fe-S protein YdhL (DUF1289 family)